MNKNKGFTLIELLVVIGIISILSSAVIVAVNPARQFKLARDTKRLTDVNAILNSIGQNMSENQGVFKCAALPNGIETLTRTIKSGTPGSDIYDCVVPNFLANIPLDPNKPGVHFTDSTDYDTGYIIVADTNGRITVAAQSEVDPLKQLTATR